MWVVCGVFCVLVVCTPLGAPYSSERPQRFMIFHVRRTVHEPEGPKTDYHYWIPELDPNTPHSVDDYGALPLLILYYFIK